MFLDESKVNIETKNSVIIPILKIEEFIYLNFFIFLGLSLPVTILSFFYTLCYYFNKISVVFFYLSLFAELEFDF